MPEPRHTHQCQGLQPDVYTAKFFNPILIYHSTPLLDNLV